MECKSYQSHVAVVIWESYPKEEYFKIVVYSTNGSLLWERKFINTHIRFEALNDNLYLSDLKNDRLLIFDLTGKLLANLTFPRIKVSGVRLPSFIITEDYILMIRNNTVDIYFENGTFWRSINSRFQIFGGDVQGKYILIYGGSRLIKLPLEKPEGFVHIISLINSSETLIEFPYPVSAVKMLDRKLLVRTTGYYYVKEDSAGYGEIYMRGGFFYLLRDVPGGYLNINSNINKTEIFVNGKWKGVAPIELPLIEGKHNITAIAFSLVKSSLVEIKEGEEKNLAFDFPYGELEIDSQVYGWVKIDTKVFGKVPGKFKLPPGVYNLTLYCFGCPKEVLYLEKNLKYTIKIEENKTTKIVVNKDILKKSIGYLEIKAENVLIDGEEIKHIIKLPLVVGEHEVLINGKKTRLIIEEGRIIVLEPQKEEISTKTSSQTFSLTSTLSLEEPLSDKAIIYVELTLIILLGILIAKELIKDSR